MLQINVLKRLTNRRSKGFLLWKAKELWTDCQENEEEDCPVLGVWRLCATDEALWFLRKGPHGKDQQSINSLDQQSSNIWMLHSKSCLTVKHSPLLYLEDLLVSFHKQKALLKVPFAAVLFLFQLVWVGIIFPYSTVLTSSRFTSEMKRLILGALLCAPGKGWFLGRMCYEVETS